MTVDSPAVSLRQAAPGDEAHDPLRVGTHDRGPFAAKRANDGIERGLVHHAQRFGAVQSVGEFVESGVLLGAPRQSRLGALFLADVEDRGDPADDFTVLVALRRRDDVHDALAGMLIIDFRFGLDALAVEHAPDRRQDSVERGLAHDLGDRLADDLLRLAAEQLGAAVADEAVPQVAAAARQHERRAVDHGLQVASRVRSASSARSRSCDRARSASDAAAKAAMASSYSRTPVGVGLTAWPAAIASAAACRILPLPHSLCAISQASAMPKPMQPRLAASSSQRVRCSGPSSMLFLIATPTVQPAAVGT